MLDVRVIIPTIMGRETLLGRALASTAPVGQEISWRPWVQMDHHGQGPAVTRNAAVAEAENVNGRSRWLAFLDDDDEFKPDHLTKLVAHAADTGADLVYPWFDLNRMGTIRNDLDVLHLNGRSPFGQPFDADALGVENYIPVSVLVRTELFMDVGGFPVPGTDAWPHADGEDWGLWKRLLAGGAKFTHLPERTWVWHHHGKNTSGRPDRARKIYQEEDR